MPNDPLELALGLATEIAEQYQLSSVQPLLNSCRSALARKEITVAIFGRFKAGKSSFLNHLLRRSILPVGVIPVTAVVTEIRFGPSEKAVARFENGVEKEISLDDIAGFISERENPGNHKGVAKITVELPALEETRGLIFVDTPGLESALAHNTASSLGWLPNAGLALVAVSVDPPLSQRDIDLVTDVYRYTPRVSILLTKVDLLSSEERCEVLDFIRGQLEKNFSAPPEILPYSVRPGFEDLREQLEQKLIKRTLREFGASHRAIVGRKIDTLLKECFDFLTLNLKAAELLAAERETLQTRVIGEKELMVDFKSALRLIVRNAISGARVAAAAVLEPYQQEIVNHLLVELAAEFPAWARSLAFLLHSFEDWADRSLSRELIRISLAEQRRLCEISIEETQRQVFRSLQQFRDRLSDSTQRAFGVPLRTTEVEIEIQEPRTPDVRVGRIFDRSWELLSPILPVALIRAPVRRHFERKIPFMVHANISRLTTQWEGSIQVALAEIQKEAERRLDELMATVLRLIHNASGSGVAKIQQHLEQIAAARRSLESI